MTTIMDKSEATKHVVSQRIRKKLTWREIADEIGKPLAWTIAALHGQHPMPEADARGVGSLLDLDESVIESLRTQPYRGTFDNPIPSDPTIYRFYEALTVYGPAIKEMIHEEFGDGIMSAINFTLTVDRRPDPDGDRVVVTFDGKFLDYRF
ncbi:cyanase [Nocardia mangyaensis]|uniref:cyanase n=1 Tax=Nocardia mangyaensis TaxID=2213200 RepID=UPI0026747C15|nr:cyanase [Nocardia mangyaensis]MDO3646272.1 cyanase [Nocardia mangyaensis]